MPGRGDEATPPATRSPQAAAHESAPWARASRWRGPPSNGSFGSGRGFRVARQDHADRDRRSVPASARRTGRVIQKRGSARHGRRSRPRSRHNAHPVAQSGGDDRRMRSKREAGGSHGTVGVTCAWLADFGLLAGGQANDNDSHLRCQAGAAGPRKPGAADRFGHTRPTTPNALAESRSSLTDSPFPARKACPGPKRKPASIERSP
jgi:hypothetical protein